MVRRQFLITQDGEENLTGFGISTAEAWQVLYAARQLTLYLDHDVLIVMACTHRGRGLYLFLEEHPTEDELWSVLAGRDMTTGELTRFIERTGSQP